MRYRYTVTDQYFEKPVIQTLSSTAIYTRVIRARILVCVCILTHMAHLYTRDQSVRELSVHRYTDNYLRYLKTTT